MKQRQTRIEPNLHCYDNHRPGLHYKYRLDSKRKINLEKWALNLIYK